MGGIPGCDDEAVSHRGGSDQGVLGADRLALGRKLGANVASHHGLTLAEGQDLNSGQQLAFDSSP